MLNKIIPILVNIFLTITLLMGLAMGSKSLTGKTWQDWLGNEELVQAQHHINTLENKLADLEKNQATIAELKSQAPFKADALVKKQKLIWVMQKLQYKFSLGEPYSQEWDSLLSLIDPSLVQNPSLQALSKFTESGVMTKAKLRKLLLSKPETPSSPPKQPSNVLEYLKSLVRIERATPDTVQDQALLAFEQGQLEKYIASHPSYEWAREPLQTLQNTQFAISDFYKALDSVLLTMEQS